MENKHHGLPLDSFNDQLINKVESKVLEQLENEEKKVDQALEDLNTLDQASLLLLRQKRIKQLEKKRENIIKFKQQQHGIYMELYNEQEFFEAVKKSRKMLVHFYRPSTWRCEIVDKYLKILSTQYLSIKCVKINAEKSPFLSERLNIWCIPTIMLIKDGATYHSIVGFDELGGDGFSLKKLVEVLKQNKMISEDEEEDDHEL